MSPPCHSSLPSVPSHATAVGPATHIAVAQSTSDGASLIYVYDPFDVSKNFGIGPCAALKPPQLIPSFWMAELSSAIPGNTIL